MHESRQFKTPVQNYFQIQILSIFSLHPLLAVGKVHTIEKVSADSVRTGRNVQGSHFYSWSRRKFHPIMVSEGPFEVEVVCARTSELFRKHVGPDDGRVYLEVEPGAEYFLQVKSNHAGGTVLIKYEVDGKGLKYCQPLRKGHRRMGGLRSVKFGKKFKKALRFQTLSTDPPDESVEYPEDEDRVWIGCIKARFYEAINSGGCNVLEDNEDYPEWEGAANENIPVSVNKGVKSCAGSAVIETKDVPLKRRIKAFKRGKKLATVKVYYSTVPGLVSIGVLPPPPASRPVA